jgi:hypothetical protein
MLNSDFAVDKRLKTVKIDELLRKEKPRRCALEGLHMELAERKG